MLYRNSLVLALHAMACVAGFMAGSSLPLSASHRSGLSRWVHEKAGPFAIALRGLRHHLLALHPGLRDRRRRGRPPAQLGTTPGILLLALIPHALPELFALFLPLAAWIIASRARRLAGPAGRHLRDGRDRRARSCWPAPPWRSGVAPHLLHEIAEP